MDEFRSTDQCVDCIAATNTPQSAAFRMAVADQVKASARSGLALDLHGIDVVERDARRQLAACKRLREIGGERG